MVKSTSTGLVAIWAATLVICISSQHVSAQGSSQQTSKGSELDAVMCRAMGKCWKSVWQIAEKGNPVTAPVPTYIISRFQEDPLSDAQMRDILERARKADLWRDIWFITVNSNFDGRYSARVYFMPDITQGNFRQGKMLPCANWIKVEPSPGRYPPLRGMLSDYVQVSAEPPECFQPDASNMPFPMPSGFTLNEIAEIVQSVYTPGVNKKLDATRAILGMQRKGESVEVEMGVREGGRSDRGGTWKCKKTNGVWAVVDSSELN